MLGGEHRSRVGVGWRRFKDPGIQRCNELRESGHRAQARGAWEMKGTAHCPEREVTWMRMLVLPFSSQETKVIYLP